MHNDFTLFVRRVPSGKKVVYYYAYDDEGRRLGPWSSGEASKTAARNYCNRLIREKRLLPGPKGTPTFAEFAEGFWEWDTCAYLKDRRKRAKLTKSYADKNRKVLDFQLIPYFGKMRLDKIGPDEIEAWIDTMTAKGYKNSTINGYFGTIRTMIRWAARKRVIAGDPLVDFGKLLNEKKDLTLVTHDEFKDLFSGDWRTVWENDVVRYTANKIAALTGMRCGEVLGLRGEYVFKDHIFLCGQHDEYGYRETKTKVKHHIPLTAELISDLERLKSVNGEGFLFSLSGGVKPVTRRYLYNGFISALKNIGMSGKEIADRGLTLHAWRHFCNTELQKGGLDIPKVQAVTGHKSTRMTDWYTHFNPEEFGKVPQIQADLLRPRLDTEKTSGGKPHLTLVKPLGDTGEWAEGA